MKICGRLSPRGGSGEDDEPWVVWIEDDRGNLAVKGTVMTDEISPNEDELSLAGDLVIQGVGRGITEVIDHR